MTSPSGIMAASPYQDEFSEAERLQKLGQYTDAEQVYSEVISKLTEHVAKENQNNHEITHLINALSKAYNNRGHLQYLRVNFDDAVDDYTHALHHDPTMTVAYYNRGLIHYRLGRFEKSIEDQKRALEIEPEFLSAKQCLQQAVIDLQAKTSKLSK